MCWLWWQSRAPEYTKQQDSQSALRLNSALLLFHLAFKILLIITPSPALLLFCFPSKYFPTFILLLPIYLMLSSSTTQFTASTHQPFINSSPQDWGNPLLMLKTEKKITENVQGSRGWMHLRACLGLPPFKLLWKAQTEKLNMHSGKITNQSTKQKKNPTKAKQNKTKKTSKKQPIPKKQKSTKTKRWKLGIL